VADDVEDGAEVVVEVEGVLILGFGDVREVGEDGELRFSFGEKLERRCFGIVGVFGHCVGYLDRKGDGGIMGWGLWEVKRVMRTRGTKTQRDRGAKGESETRGIESHPTFIGWQGVAGRWL